MIEMTNEMELRIYDALEYRYGASGQITVAIEELAELTQALTKWLRFYKFGWLGEGVSVSEIREHIREEIADVSIMVTQLELMFGDTGDIQEQKLQRMFGLVEDMFDEDGKLKPMHWWREDEDDG